jgi:hypothetical protein
MCAACWPVLLQVTIVNQLQGQRQQVTVVGDDAQVRPTPAGVAFLAAASEQVSSSAAADCGVLGRHCIGQYTCRLSVTLHAPDLCAAYDVDAY